MAIIFDGRKFAAEKEASLAVRVLGLKARGVYPKLASVLVGNDPASQLYVNLKKKAAERIGVELDIYLIKENSNPEDLILLIKTLDDDKNVHGIMIQMPIPGKMGDMKDEIVNTIDPEKDVDGLRNGSFFLHPTSKAVIQILDEAKKLDDLPLKTRSLKVVVVGATGMVGAPLVKELKEEKYEVIACDTNTPNLKVETQQGDVIVSCTGIPNIITGGMVKDGTIVIDVGSPKGDVDSAEVSKKASFISPVPGGVGPVTITCLLENLLSAVD